MRIRPFRRADGPRFFELLRREFPEEEAVLGMRPEGMEAILRRLYRPDVRFMLGLARAFHRSPFHLYVAEEDGTIAGMVLLAFSQRAGFLSTLVVAPEFRRRGFARQLLETGRREAARRGRRYIALGVLANNVPARALYEAVGYQPLEHQTFFVHDAPSVLGSAPSVRAIRPFRRSDARQLAAVANRTNPPQVLEVLPMRPRDLVAGRLSDRIFNAESQAWVVDLGHGPLAHVRASTSPVTEAAHLSAPIVDESVNPELAADLVRTAGAWLAPYRRPRIATNAAEGNRRGRQALEAVGFHVAFEEFTLYQSTG